MQLLFQSHGQSGTNIFVGYHRVMALFKGVLAPITTMMSHTIAKIARHPLDTLHDITEGKIAADKDTVRRLLEDLVHRENSLLGNTQAMREIIFHILNELKTIDDYRTNHTWFTRKKTDPNNATSEIVPSAPPAIPSASAAGVVEFIPSAVLQHTGAYAELAHLHHRLLALESAMDGP